METFVKWMNKLTTLSYWLMMAMVPLLILGAAVRIFSGSMNRQAGAEYMLVGGSVIGSSMFLFLILKIITSLMEENLKGKAETDSEEEIEKPSEL